MKLRRLTRPVLQRGRAACHEGRASGWPEENFDAIGHRSTLDLGDLEGDARLPAPGLADRPAAG
jgi:hypothetical protein